MRRRRRQQLLSRSTAGATHPPLRRATDPHNHLTPASVPACSALQCRCPAAGYGAASYAEMLQGARRTPADLAAFVELHIEQARQHCTSGSHTALAHRSSLPLRAARMSPPVQGTSSASPMAAVLQGPLLEKERKQIGIVTAIAAPAALRVRFSGEAACLRSLAAP